MRRFLVMCAMLLFSILMVAQTPKKVTAKLEDAQTGQSVSGARVEFSFDKDFQNEDSILSNSEGVFTLEATKNGKLFIRVTAKGYQPYSTMVDISSQVSQVQLGVLSLMSDVAQDVLRQQVILLSDNELEDDDSTVEQMSGLLQSTQDVFMRRAAFDFGAAFFKPRGMDSKEATVLINGIPMNRLDSGRPQWGNWGGLNDVTREQELSVGLKPSEYTFGGAFGSNYINVRPSLFRPGLRVSASASNQSYNGRVMATYNSGVLRNGLAYSFSASRRWAPTQGYIDGTQYNAYSVFGALEYQFNNENSLNLIGMFTPNRRGKTSPLTKEVIDLMGYRYNPMWGYQEGKVRNSRQRILAEPIFVLSYRYNSQNTRANVSLGYQFGNSGNTQIQYANAQNPEPNYYKNLPSYYLNKKDATQADVEMAGVQKEYFLSHSQIDWLALYRQNINNKESLFITSNDRVDEKTLSASANLTTKIDDHIDWTIGAVYRNVFSENYAQITDLLGGSYFMNYNYFSLYPYDANETDLRKSVGDKWRYNYNIRSNVGEAFTQFQFKYGMTDFYVAGKYSYTDYQRDGLYDNPKNKGSYGKGVLKVYQGVSTKAGINYAITGRHILQANVGYFNNPQTLRATYANVRSSNDLIEGLANEEIYTADASYILRLPFVKGRLTGYFSQTKNGTENSFFFTQSALTGDFTSNFVVQSIEGIEKRSIGMELGLEAQILPTLKATGVVAIGQHTYLNNPNVSLSSDDFARISLDQAYLKNYFVATGPQRAYSLGLEYRDPHYWWISATANLLTDNYISISGINRTKNFFKDPATQQYVANIDKDLARSLLKQERLEDMFLVNVVGGKSWKIKKMYISAMFSVNNILGKSYRIGGFEQSRTANYEALVRDNAKGTPSFGPRYFIGNGRTYMLNVAFSI